MRIKICGITRPEQGSQIAQLGATTLGFICVAKSPRYIEPDAILATIKQLPVKVSRIGVFADSTPEAIAEVVSQAELTGVQLHGEESPQACQQLRRLLPQIELIKAIRVKTPQSLVEANSYSDYVDALLLDAYHPQLLGGTGKTLNWETLNQFRPRLPWLLAGGLTPGNVGKALNLLRPDGIDLSSGVERSPGDKDLNKVALLFTKLREIS